MASYQDNLPSVKGGGTTMLFSGFGGRGTLTHPASNPNPVNLTLTPPQGSRIVITNIMHKTSGLPANRFNFYLSTSKRGNLGSSSATYGSEKYEDTTPAFLISQVRELVFDVDEVVTITSQTPSSSNKTLFVYYHLTL